MIVGMRIILAAAILFASFARADEASDRADIERTISALNKAQNEGERRELFTADAGNELDRLPRNPDSRPWSEVNQAIFVIQTVRFVNPEVALVDAANSQFGSTILVRRTPVLLVMKKEKGVWKIASLRLLADPANVPIPLTPRP
jgi:hypothetical protein